jgi:hypothetical protein
LTFAVAIQGVPAGAAAPTAGTPAAAGARVATAAPDDVPPDQIDAWLVSDQSKPTPDRPSGVYDGDTVTFQTYREARRGSSGTIPTSATPPPPPEPSLSDQIEAQLGGIEMLPEGRGDEGPTGLDEPAEEGDAPAADDEETGSAGEELIDESNPFYAAKKQAAAAAAEPAKPSYKDSSDAASDILRKMLDRRRPGG